MEKRVTGECKRILDSTVPTKKQLKAIISHKTKKQKHIKLNGNDKQQSGKVTDFLKWPYYKSFISGEEQARLLTEFKELDFKYDSTPYKPILFNRRTPIIPATFNGKYIKFIDANYLKYDILPLIYSETELLKCQFRTNPPAITYFEKMKQQFAAEFLKQNKRQHTLAEYREFLFSKVKQCNNFRPTLALQTYNFLNINKSGDNVNQSILDFSAGWGDRLFAACIGDKKYIGLDPNTNNTHIYESIINAHGKPDMQKVIATGAEYISIHDLKIHMTALGIKQFDLIFTSPPYFDYEIYADAAQSISNYSASSATGFDKWLTYFLLNVIMRYVPVLRDNGYIGIYIQDADNNNYLEPIGLFVLAFAEQLGLTVCGIISSTRYPFIVLQKVGTHNVLPYKNPDNKKVFNKAGITGLFRKQYPVLYQLCERLLRLNKYNMLTPVLTSNAPIVQHYKNIIKRAFEKVFMQLDVIIDTVYIDDTFLVVPISYGLQEFKRVLEHFKIKLLPVSNLITTQEKKTVKSVYLEIKTPLKIPYKQIPWSRNFNYTPHHTDNPEFYTPSGYNKNRDYAVPTIVFETILLNTVDEWLLLNKKNTGDIIMSELIDLLLVKSKK